MANLDALQVAMGVTFRTPSLLEQALVHSSYVNENPDAATGSNERLEFLGDAVLGVVVAEKLYQDFPHLPEGEMTKLRSALVRRGTLAGIATTLKLGDYLRLGKGEEAGGGRSKPANLAAVMEAVIAAVFLDQGLVAAGDFTLSLLNEELLKVVSQAAADDYKSRLQEVIQSRQQLTPTYRLVEATGPDHDKRFSVVVMAGDIVLGRGSGKSKKLAETEAARTALEHLASPFTP